MTIPDLSAPKNIGVAMSGGVDSSTAAWLLREHGHTVAGFTMVHTGTPMDRAAVASARAVCDFLGIAHHVVDIRAVFRESVIDDFCSAYFNGLTPNPCVVCNKHIKFGLLLDHITGAGMRAMATGHYAIIESSANSGSLLLKKGADPIKDQTYFLYRLNQAALSRAVFPNGKFTKNEIRAMALKAGLPVSGTPESQEICFVPADYGAFVAAHMPHRVKQGQIVDEQGKLLGWHEGIHLYTVGQRRGLGVAAPEPLYVLRLDPAQNRVVVAPDKMLFQSSLLSRENSFVCGSPPEEPVLVHVKIRYNAPAVPATLMPRGADEFHVAFHEPQRAVTPGQSAVFYSGDTVLGGGIIQE